MTDETHTQVPPLPESANSTGQQVATTQAPAGELVDRQLPIPPSPYGDIADHFRGLGSGKENLRFSPEARAMMLAAMEVAADYHRADREELHTLRAEHRALQDRYADLRVRHATISSDLRNERPYNRIRSITSNLGSVMIGLIPYAAHKANLIGGLICGIFGGLLFLVGFGLFADDKPRASGSFSSDAPQGEQK